MDRHTGPARPGVGGPGRLRFAAIRRTLAPALAPIRPGDLLSGLRGLLRGERELDRLARELKSHFGSRHCFLVGSGKAALCVALEAFKDMHPERDHVVVPSYTCYSVPSAVTRARLKAMPCDIRRETLDLDPKQLAALLPADGAPGAPGARILAVLPTHLFGLEADVDGVRRAAGGPPPFVVEDAAQAMGEAWDGRLAGTLGDVGIFSLGRGKVLSCVEGGVILTDRSDVAERIEARMRRLPGYGPAALAELAAYGAVLWGLARPSLFWLPMQLPFLRLGQTVYDPGFPVRRMSPLQAGMLRRWRQRLRAWGGRRSENARRWMAALRRSPWRTYAREPCGGLIRFPVLARDAGERGRLVEAGSRAGLGLMPGYPASIDRIPGLSLGPDGGSFPEGRAVAERLFTLPTHPLVSGRDRERIERFLDGAM